MKRCDFFQLPDRKLMEILPASGTSHKTGLINVKKRKLPLKMWGNHVALATFSRWLLENKRPKVLLISICLKDIHIGKKTWKVCKNMWNIIHMPTQQSSENDVLVAFWGATRTVIPWKKQDVFRSRKKKLPVNLIPWCLPNWKLTSSHYSQARLATKHLLLDKYSQINPSLINHNSNTHLSKSINIPWHTLYTPRYIFVKWLTHGGVKSWPKIACFEPNTVGSCQSAVKDLCWTF